MPALEAPKLDDRGYDELRRELLRRIPMHSPTWTDHNPGDPGITLLELFAWLTDNLLYRLNRVPDKALVQFLNLLDVPLRQATPAQVLLRFSLRSGLTEPRLLDYMPTRPRTVVSAGSVEFQVVDEVDVLPIEGLPMIKRRQTHEEESALQGRNDMVKLLQQTVQDLPLVQPEDLVTYRTFLLPEPEGNTLPPSTSLGTAVDQALWLALLAPAPPAGEEENEALRRGIAGRTLCVGVQVDDELCGATDHHRCPDIGSDFPDSPPPQHPIVWQIATGEYRGGERTLHDLRYDPLVIRKDGTDGLTRSGVVQLELPGEGMFGHWRRDELEDEQLMGAGDLPPLLPEEQQEQRVLTWVRCFKPPDSTVYPRVRWIGINAVRAEQAVSAPPEILGRGNGIVGQEFRLSNAPVLPEGLFVQVQQGGEWVAWRRQESFAESWPDDPHYVLEPQSGVIRFGDGRNGRALQLGELVRVESYRHGGGAQGNIAAGSINRVVRTPGDVPGINVTNDLPASGGKDDETPDAARARIPKVLRHRDRAVAVQDFQDIALETPRVHVGRTEVLPRHKPHERVNGVPGVVTLIVVPAYDPLNPDEPMPDREMLRRVCEYLEPRRLVTTELYVTAPEYVPIWVSVAVEVEEGYGIGTVGRWVDLAVRQYFAPLAPYGPRGGGWPFGRDVRKNDIEAAALRVEGVRVVTDVVLWGSEIGREGSRREVRSDEGERPDSVTLHEWQLPAIRNMQVSASEDAPSIQKEGDTTLPPGMDPDSITIISVPAEVEKC